MFECNPVEAYGWLEDELGLPITEAMTDLLADGAIIVTYPTDLSPAEEQQARERLAELADRFSRDGDLRTPEWRAAFLATWRHPYVPAYYPATDRPPALCVDPEQRADWLNAVYSNQTLVTKVQPVPLNRAFRPATGWMNTSSSTLPLLVLRMLEDLDVRDGHRVLEIGTGSGYNCALLCQRLGSEYVTSVDIDPELVDLAAERLAANGYTPTVAAVDGAEGYPPNAPYDRIIATCAVRAIPASWLKQAAPGAVVITDVHGRLGGTLVRLTVDSAGTATGRFVPYWTAFMPMRSTVEPDGLRPRPWYDDEQIRSVTEIDPDLVLQPREMLGFLLQWIMPDISAGQAITDEGKPAVSWRPLTARKRSSRKVRRAAAIE
ncbi:hypothetical protein BJF78_14020 [Pseudonocardia sp. CNS-139]|nr:hypothetical protein BJF78_14020 [Pseudonocardia sp. CNS-139]